MQSVSIRVLPRGPARYLSSRVRDNSGQLRIGLLPGDGIGKEIVPAARRVLEALNVELSFVELSAGFETFRKTGSALPVKTIEEARLCDGILFGCVSSPKTAVPGYSSPIIALRKELDLFANLRPITSNPVKRIVPGTRKEVNMLVVRENTECLLSAKERTEQDGNTAIAERVITRNASRRIAMMAFQQARKRFVLAQEEAEHQARFRTIGLEFRPPLVTIVHKANVLPVTDGLFLSTALEVAKQFDEIFTEDMSSIAPNLYGDILQDLAAALVGGLDLVPTANVGEKYILTHGSNIVTSPTIARPGYSNPLGTIRAAAMLLSHLGLTAAADAVEKAVNMVLAHGPYTPDLGGSTTTEECVKAVISQAQYFQHLATIEGGSV